MHTCMDVATYVYTVLAVDSKVLVVGPCTPSHPPSAVRLKLDLHHQTSSIPFSGGGP